MIASVTGSAVATGTMKARGRMGAAVSGGASAVLGHKQDTSDNVALARDFTEGVRHTGTQGKLNIGGLATATPDTAADFYAFLDATDSIHKKALLSTLSGSGAPTDAEYVTTATHAGLSAERVITDTATISKDTGTAGQVKLNLAISGQSTGDILYFNGTNWIRLAIGSEGAVLTVASGIPAWISG